MREGQKDGEIIEKILLDLLILAGAVCKCDSEKCHFDFHTKHPHPKTPFFLA